MSRRGEDALRASSVRLETITHQGTTREGACRSLLLANYTNVPWLLGVTDAIPNHGKHPKSALFAHHLRQAFAF